MTAGRDVGVGMRMTRVPTAMGIGFGEKNVSLNTTLWLCETHSLAPTSLSFLGQSHSLTTTPSKISNVKLKAVK